MKQINQQSSINDLLQNKIKRSAIITTIIASIAIITFIVQYFMKQRIIAGFCELAVFLISIVSFILIIKNKIKIGIGILLYSIIVISVIVPFFIIFGYNHPHFEIVLFSEIPIFCVIVVLLGFLVGRKHSVIAASISGLYLIISSFFIRNDFALENLASPISSLLAVTIITFYFEGLFRKLLNKSVEETEVSKKALSNIKIIIEKTNSLKEKVDISQENIFKQLKEIDDIIISNIDNIDTLAKSTEILKKDLDDNKEDLEILTTSVNDIVEKIETQSAHITQNASALEEMIVSVKSITDNSKKASEYNNRLVEVAEEGKIGIEDVMKTINELEQYQSKMLDILNSIRSISNQTNMLAMNANIEAAHAGDIGRGFGVVANEIRKLADESGIKTKEIDTLIKSMNQQIAKSINKVTEVNHKLLFIIDGINNVYPIIQQISMSMEEQTTVNMELMSSTKNIIEITQSIKDNALSEKTISDNYNNRFTRLIEQITNFNQRIESISLSNERFKSFTENISAIKEENNLINNEIKSLLTSD